MKMGGKVTLSLAVLLATCRLLAVGVPEEVDVLVVGGTAKGVAAATAAAKAGANTYLITPYTYLGEDLAGTLELGLAPGAKPTLPLVKKLWSGMQGLAPFDYWPDKRTPHPRAVFHNDWWDRLSEPGRPTSPTDGVYYESDVSYKCVLRKPSEISRLEVIVFEKSGKKNPPKAKDRGMVARAGNAATAGVTCTVKAGPRKGETIELKRLGSAFGVEGDANYRGVNAIRFSADIGTELSEVELVVRKDPEAHQQYVARIWFLLANPESFSMPPSPLKAKRTFDRELIDAGVGFITSTAVRQVLRGPGGIAGVEIVNRSGRSVIRAKRVIDATRYGALGDLGRPKGGEAEFSRIVIAVDDVPKADGMTVEKLAETFPISHLKAKGEVLGVMYRCTMKLPMRDFSYPSFAAAEWEARERTWVNGTLDDSDILVWRTAGWKDLETRIREGEAEGVKAAKAARAMKAAPKVRAGAAKLPVWGEYDVVVVGGGTSGSPTAIAAARAGAKVLLVEYLSVLGGVGTDGMILGYYDGNHCGFTEEFKKANAEIGGRFGLYRRAETWRKWCREAGVTVWLGAMGSGAVVEKGKLTAVEVATPLGCGLVKAKCFVDATGNADVAAAAGAETAFLSAKEFALQSAGQAPHRLGRGGINSDFGYLDDSNASDLWLFGLRARAGAPNAWDIAKMPDSRERRRIVPDYAVNAMDVNARRPFPDVVVQARSRQDSHGYLTDDFRFLSSPSAVLYKEKENRWKYDVNVPLRSLLPKGLSGLAVIGIASGCARDVLPMVRMQADLMNMGYSVGTAAAMAAKNGGEFRKIDFGALRRTLVDKGILREEVLGWDKDTDVSSDAVLAAAVRSMGPAMEGSHVVYRAENRERAIPLLREAYAKAATPVEKQNYAKMLGFMGDATGAETLADIVSGKRKIIPFANEGAFGHATLSMDGFMIALGRTRAPCALQPLLMRLAMIKPGQSVTAIRAVCLSLEALGSPEAAPGLAACLKMDGYHGFAVKKPTDLPPQGGYGLGPEMDNCIREIGFARALWACGDYEGLAKRTLEQYAADPRGVLSAHAKAILATRK